MPHLEVSMMLSSVEKSVFVRLSHRLLSLASSAACLLGFLSSSPALHAAVTGSPVSQTSATSGWRGPWTSTATYAVNDLVSYNGGLYVNTAATAPATVTTNVASGPVNLFDKNSITDGYVVFWQDGTLGNVGGFGTSNYINVAGASSFVTNIIVSVFEPYGMAYYDANKNYVSGTTVNGNGYYNAGTVFKVPAGVTYVRFWFQYSNMGANLNTAVVNTGTTLQSTYSAFGSGGGTPVTTTTPSAAPSDSTHWASLGASTGGAWAGKKMFVLADSIIWANTGAAQQIATAVGATLSSQGTTAPGIDAVPGRTFSQFQNGYVPITASTIADVDLMLICLGTNQDSQLGIGSPSDAPNLNGTMSAQLRAMLETIMSWKPGMRIVVVGPYASNRYNVQAGVDGLQGNQDSGRTVLNAGSLAVLNKINVGMKAVTNLYGIPYVDMYDESGVNFTTSPLWLTDGLHPNSTGYNSFYVPYIAAQLPRFVH